MSECLIEMQKTLQMLTKCSAPPVVPKICKMTIGWWNIWVESVDLGLLFVFPQCWKCEWCHDRMTHRFWLIPNWNWCNKFLPEMVQEIDINIICERMQYKRAGGVYNKCSHDVFRVAIRPIWCHHLCRKSELMFPVRRLSQAASLVYWVPNRWPLIHVQLSRVEFDLF